MNRVPDGPRQATAAQIITYRRHVHLPPSDEPVYGCGTPTFGDGIGKDRGGIETRVRSQRVATIGQSVLSDAAQAFDAQSKVHASLGWRQCQHRLYLRWYCSLTSTDETNKQHQLKCQLLTPTAIQVAGTTRAAADP